MFPQHRKAKILEWLEQSNSLKVAEISNKLGVSEATVRRDLQELEEEGLLLRTHGGAVSQNLASFEPSFTERETAYPEAKKIIGQLAADLVSDGETIILDAGTTTIEIARQLKIKRNLTVVTNSVDVIRELAGCNEIELLVVGGNIRPKTQAMVGPVAESTLNNINVDKVFLAANGLNKEKGLTTPNLLEAMAKRAMLKAAETVYVVADYSKWSKITFSNICHWSEVNMLITDREPPKEYTEYLTELGVQVKLPK
jgi:DeoR family fructose operon transcriptional repressor